MQKKTPVKETKSEEIIVSKDGLLLATLLGTIKSKSRTTVKSYLTHRQVLINNEITTQHDAPVICGDKIVINHGRGPETFRHPMMRIVFEDQYIIVIEKQNGLLSMGTDSEREKTAYFILSAHVKRSDPDNRIFILHRLDRETSGLMMFARDEKTQSKMQHNWSEMVHSRKYVAVVEGTPPHSEGVITTRLSENKNFKVYVSKDDQGEEATTRYRLLKKGRVYSLVELELETGKKNQIRAHMEHLGIPIAGDKKYGANVCDARRVCLHAQTLNITHPVTGEKLNFTTPVPAAFSALVK